MEAHAEAEFIEVKSPIDRFREEWAKLPGKSAFLRQRRLLLHHPEMLQYAELARPGHWKQPLIFGLQGLLLAAFLISAFSWLMTRDEGFYADEIAKVHAELDSQLKTEQGVIDATQFERTKIENSRKTSGFTVAAASNLTRDEALQQLNVIVEEAQKQQDDHKLHAAIKTQNLRAAGDGFALAASGTPVMFSLALIFAAPLFGMMMRRQYARHKLVLQADNYYLYYVAGIGLWMNLIFVVVLNISLSGSAYGLGGFIEGIGPIGRLIFWLALYSGLVYWFFLASKSLHKAVQLPKLRDYATLDNKVLLNIHNSFWITFIVFEAVLGLLAYGVYAMERAS